jgi:DNA-binding response OmpR family regulator
MKKKVIILAENSYTIRRIVELTFSEIENIEMRSFENGSGLKEKLLQLEPDAVIVDIKLPEVNGYEICRFINETPSLKHSRVFLLKGSFDPVDNEMIKNLKYEDIITKPFDSNALVASVMKVVNQEEKKAHGEFPEDVPSSFPEEFTEIETNVPGADGISFSDIRSDFEAQLSSNHSSAKSQGMERDEILPSEEITQGTQPTKDELQAPVSEESIKNPFEGEPVFEEVKTGTPGMFESIAQQPEKEPAVSTQAADSVPKDVSDEFHERFLEVSDEDTSEDMQKSSLEVLKMVENDDMQFPPDLKDEKFATKEDDLSADFVKKEADVPLQTMYSEKEAAVDFMTANQKKENVKEKDAMLENVFGKELFAEKTRPEVISPQEELEMLVRTPKKETKTEPKFEPELSLKDKLDLSGKLEDKLSLTIKELLWEIIPPLAEKIIKEEIDKIKSDLNNTGL